MLNLTDARSRISVPFLELKVHQLRYIVSCVVTAREHCVQYNELHHTCTHFLLVDGLYVDVMQTLDAAVAEMQKSPKYAVKFKNLGTKAFTVNILQKAIKTRAHSTR